MPHNQQHRRADAPRASLNPLLNLTFPNSPAHHHRAAVQSNEVYPTPPASARLTSFGRASDKRFPLWRALHKGWLQSVRFRARMSAATESRHSGTAAAADRSTHKPAIHPQLWGLSTPRPKHTSPVTASLTHELALSTHCRLWLRSVDSDKADAGWRWQSRSDVGCPAGQGTLETVPSASGAMSKAMATARAWVSSSPAPSQASKTAGGCAAWTVLRNSASTRKSMATG